MVTVRAAEAVILGDKSQHAKDDGGERERVGLLQDLVQPRTHPGAGGGALPQRQSQPRPRVRQDPRVTSCCRSVLQIQADLCRGRGKRGACPLPPCSLLTPAPHSHSRAAQQCLLQPRSRRGLSRPALDIFPEDIIMPTGVLRLPPPASPWSPQTSTPCPPLQSPQPGLPDFPRAVISPSF